MAAERDELGITAGYQDRVIQAYGGCVYMDFDRNLMKSRGYGQYEQLGVKPGAMDGLWLAYQRQGKDSGKVHRNIKELFEAGDESIRDGMQKLAFLAEETKHILLSSDDGGRLLLANLMSRNFGKPIYYERQHNVYDDT